MWSVRTAGFFTAACILIGAGLAAVALHPPTTAHGSDYPLANLGSFGISLAEIPVGPGAHPLLPDGTSGVSQDQAVASALRNSAASDANGALVAGVQVAAAYGIFTNSEIRPLGAGPSAARYQSFPAWIVSFTGPGVNVYSVGPPNSPTLVSHEQSVVIDAKTGDFIESVS